MDVKLLINDMDYDLDRNSIEAIIRALPDTEHNSLILEELAQSSSARIRRIIASKHYLDNEIYFNLLMDDSKRVFNTLLENEHFLKYMNHEHIDSLIDVSDNETLSKLAENFIFMTEAVANHLYLVIGKGPLTILSKIKNFVLNDSFICNLDRGKLEYLISTGETDILKVIASYINEYTEEFSVCEMDWLCQTLIDRDNSEVKLNLIENGITPDSFIKQLAKDADSNVSDQAKKTLKEREEEYSSFE